MRLKRPDYVKWADGKLVELYCKICGDQVGGQTSRLVGKHMENGTMVHDHVLEFKRFPKYTEAKIEFEDGSFHVTLGCERCLSQPMTPGFLDQIHLADLDMAPGQDMEPLKERRAKRLIGIKVGGGIE